MKKIEEKRKFIRLEIPVELKYIAEGGSARKESTTKDLSCEGLRFTTEEELKKGSSLELNINVPDANNPVHVKGKVVWSRRLSSEDKSLFETGI